MLKKTSLALALAAGAMLLGTPAYAGGDTGLANELQLVPCLSNFSGIGISVPVSNVTNCGSVK